jgi:hypothetical protein
MNATPTQTFDASWARPELVERSEPHHVKIQNAKNTGEREGPILFGSMPAPWLDHMSLDANRPADARPLASVFLILIFVRH